MKTICYLFIFVFEQFISYIYFYNKFTSKRSHIQIIISYFLSFIIQFAINLLGIPELNLITFFICNTTITLMCFESSIKQAIFNVLLLEGIMITSELAMMHLTSLILNIDLQKYLTDNNIIILETIETKILYFLLAYIASKISIKEKKQTKTKDVSYLLFLLPISAIAIIISFTYLSINYEINYFAKLLFTNISIILLITNVIAFLVHESMINTLNTNLELQLENQKKEINKEYYTELEKQYDSSNILIHDIKKCLINIKELSYQKENDRIIEYINSIYNGYEIKSLKQYSNNKLVNVIVSRYAQLCNEFNINISIDIRNIDFSFITDSDLTALLDNLLENAFEASKNATIKRIDLIINNRNEKYILINILNSSDSEPQKIGKTYITTKNDSHFHGIGLKSISRIVKKYSGNLESIYNKDNKTFHTSVLLKIPEN